MDAEKVRSTHEVIKAPQDKREYRGFVLTNGLKLLLMSDPSLKKAAAAVNLGVGSMSDPEDILGLCNLCQRMVQMGSKKFPKKEGYSLSLTDHGGKCTSRTSLDSTVFSFDVIQADLHHSLEMMVDFLADPVLDKSYLVSCISRIDREYVSNMRRCDLQLRRVDQVTCAEKHEFSKFMLGCKETLDRHPKQKKLEVIDVLKGFHAKYYSSNLMTACVISKLSLAELAKLAVDTFSKLVNKNTPTPTVSGHPFKDSSLQMQMNVVPEGTHTRLLRVTFPMNAVPVLQRASPWMFVAQLCKRPKEGSLFHYLQAKNWVGGLRVQPDDASRSFFIFAFEFDLLLEGTQHTAEIVDTLFQYLNLLRTVTGNHHVFEDLRNLLALNFKYGTQTKSVIDEVVTFSAALHSYHWNDVACGSVSLKDFNLKSIQALLAALIPDNARVTTVCREFLNKTDKVEHFYKIKYSAEKIPPAKIEAWKNVGLNPALRLPPKNPFVPVDVELAPEEAAYQKTPVRLIEDSQSLLWFMQEAKQLAPKSVAFIQLRTPVVSVNAVNRCQAELLICCFRDSVKNLMDLIEVAGMSLELLITDAGLEVRIQGYSPKQSLLIDEILEKLIHFSIDESRFDALKESLQPTIFQPIGEKMTAFADYMLSDSRFSNDELNDSIEKCTAKGCQTLLSSILETVWIQVLVYGSTSSSEAKCILSIVKDKLKCKSWLTSMQTPCFRSRELDRGSTYVYNFTSPPHTSNCVLFYHQLGLVDTENLKLSAVAELFAQFLVQPCNEVLVRKLCLGFPVTATCKRSFGILGLQIVIETTINVNYVANQIGEFLDVSMKKYLDEVPDEVFEELKKPLLTVRMDSPYVLNCEVIYYWREVSNRTYLFDRRRKEAAEIRKLTRKDITNFFDSYIHSKGEKRACLVICCQGGGCKDTKFANEELTLASKTISGLGKFRTEQKFFDMPSPKSPL